MSVTYYTEENNGFVNGRLMEWILDLIQTNDMQKREEYIHLIWCLIEEARLKGTSSIVSDFKFKDSFTLKNMRDIIKRGNFAPSGYNSKNVYDTCGLSPSIVSTSYIYN